MNDIGRERKLGVGAYIALAFAIVFFSGLTVNDKLTKLLPNKQWVEAISALDFKTINGHFGTAVSKVTASDTGKIKTGNTTFRGANGTGAADGFLFAIGLIPTVMFALAVVAVVEHFGALEAARRLLTPLLEPLMGIPGQTGLALIGSLQSTDAGGAMTRQLADANDISEKEKDIFTMFQFSAGATLTNFFASGAVLFTLKAADGTQAVTVSIGLCIAVMLIMKVVGANLMRLVWRFVSQDENSWHQSAEVNERG